MFYISQSKEVFIIIYLLCTVIMFLLVVVDQLTKVIMKIWLEPISTATFIPHVVRFNYAENTGAAFSSLQNARWFFITVTTIACIAMLYFFYAKKIKSGILQTAVVFIVSGGIGNLIDRIFRGYVIDFIEPVFVDFAIFNFADCLVTVGSAIVVCYLVYDIVRESKQEKLKKRSGENE